MEIRDTSCLEDIRIVDDVFYPNFHHVYNALGFYDEDKEYMDGIIEAYREKNIISGNVSQWSYCPITYLDPHLSRIVHGKFCYKICFTFKETLYICMIYNLLINLFIMIILCLVYYVKCLLTIFFIYSLNFLDL